MKDRTPATGGSAADPGGPGEGPGGNAGDPPRLVDLHCHFVPGVDDGAPSVERALHYLEEGLRGGVRRVVTTPHLPASRASGPLRARIEDAFGELREAAARQLPGLELSLAYELRLDGAGVDPDDHGLWLGPAGHVLVEYDLFSLPEDPVAPLSPLLRAGRVPVLAHPERYRGAGRPGWPRRLRSAGVKLCVNAGSLVGRYGPGPRSVARELLAEGRVDVVASDHHARPERSQGLAETWALLTGLGFSEAARVLLSRNPGAVAEGGETAPAPVVRLPGEGAADPREETPVPRWEGAGHGGKSSR